MITTSLTRISRIWRSRRGKVVRCREQLWSVRLDRQMDNHTAGTGWLAVRPARRGYLFRIRIRRSRSAWQFTNSSKQGAGGTHTRDSFEHKDNLHPSTTIRNCELDPKSKAPGDSPWHA